MQSRKKTKYHKIIKEWNEATKLEIWHGVRDNFIFGFLGALYLAKEPTSLSSVTGAQYDSIVGIFHLP